MLRRLRKEIFLRSGQWPNDEKTLLYIGGSQRSGTTMLQEVFSNDQNIRTYGETGLCDENRQLLPFAELEKAVANRRGAIHVIKPLCGCHAIDEYVQVAPTRSRAIWMFRHYADVVKSDLHKWGHLQSEMRRMRAFVNYSGSEKVDKWASFGATDEVREVISCFYDEEMKPEDAAALYWWARNQLWHNTGLSELPQAMLLSYHAVMKNPHHWIRTVYRFLGHSYPGNRVIDHVRKGDGTHGKIVLSSAIQDLCEETWEDLCAENRQQETSLQPQNGRSIMPAQSNLTTQQIFTARYLTQPLSNHQIR